MASAEREAAFFEATDELVRVALAVVSFHYARVDDKIDDVAGLHARLADAAATYLDAPSIYRYPTEEPS